MSYFPSLYTLNAATSRVPATDSAGLELVMPLVPVETLVSCDVVPFATETAYTSGMPFRLETKYNCRPSCDHWGLIESAPANVCTRCRRALDSSIVASSYCPIASVSRFVVNRSVANAIVRLSGDQAGCTSAYASLVRRCSRDAIRSYTYRSLNP